MTILRDFCTLLVLLLVGCAAAFAASDAVDEGVERAQDDARRARADVMEIRAALPRAAAARWELRSRVDSSVISLPIPPAEWSVLKTALSHTEPTPRLQSAAWSASCTARGYTSCCLILKGKRYAASG